MKIRIKFRKYGVMKFIGHLDMMRYFQKAMRRADIDIAYSEGFSPHQIMSFAAPLGVGVTSDGEYLDIKVHSTRSSAESLKALNEVMVEGIQVTEYRRLPKGTKNAMSSVAAADYRITFPGAGQTLPSVQAISEAIQAFYEGQSEILVVKQTKKGERTMDLKPLIYEWKALMSDSEGVGFYLKVCTGSTDNVKPELTLNCFFDWCRAEEIFDFQYQPAEIHVHRLDVYAQSPEGGFLPLGELGEDISEAS